MDMPGMTNEQDLKRVFKAKRVNIPDNGLSQQVRKNLSEGKGILLQIIVPVSAIVGFTLVVAIFGMMPIYSRMLELILALSHLEMPPALSILTYLSGLTILGFIAFATAGTEESD